MQGILNVGAGEKGSSGKCVGTIGVSDDREKSFGAPEAQISPQQPKFEPLPKRFFSPSYSKDLIYRVHLRINRMNQKKPASIIRGMDAFEPKIPPFFLGRSL